MCIEQAKMRFHRRVLLRKRIRAQPPVKTIETLKKYLSEQKEILLRQAMTQLVGSLAIGK